MNVYVKIKNNRDISKLYGADLKVGLQFFFDLFFRCNPSREHLLQEGKLVLFLQDGMISAGNLDCIVDEWREVSYLMFLSYILRDNGHYISINGNKYDRETGVRLTNCCGAYATFHDAELSCRVCYEMVSDGEGDGDEQLLTPE